MSTSKEKILIHVCCAICGAALTELLKDKFEAVLYFYNPNIHPEDEYLKRRDAVKSLAEIYNVKFFEGNYDKENWFEIVKGLEKEPEGGARCPVCFKMRLEKAGEFAKEQGCAGFLTTLAMSPYKNELQINEIGKFMAEKFGLQFLTIEEIIGSIPGIDHADEFKKKIWQKSRELARQYQFYHQKYCGCVYSMRK